MEGVILKHLITDSVYFSKVYSYLSEGYFYGADADIFYCISEFVNEYKKQPLPKELGVNIRKYLKQNDQESCITRFKEIMIDDTKVSQEFLLKETTNFIKNSEMRQAIINGASLIENKKDIGNIVEKLEKAVSFELETDIGMKDSDIQKRMKLRNKENISISTGINSLDEVLGGGFRQSSLNFICSVTHGGKSMFLTHMASICMMNNKNVIYITLEMPDLSIWNRIESNLFAIDIVNLKDIDLQQQYDNFGNNLGRCVVKEYGARTFNMLDLKSLVEKIENNLEVNIDVVIIDYITLMSSYVLPANSNLYQYKQAIVEEAHSYAKTTKKTIITAAQLNRSAFNDTNNDMSKISESIGIAQTADVMINLNRTIELDKIDQVSINIVKNRNTGLLSQLYLNVNYSQSRYFDLYQ